MAKKEKHAWFRSLLALAIIWLVGAVGDRIWFALDNSIPAWDQADYLTGSLNYWQALQQPQWLESEWWTSFWLLSSKIPPLTYIATAFVQNLFGTGSDQATLVNLLFSVILLGSVYGLGVELFSVEVGLWAAGLCQLLPALYRSRLDFLLDYPLAAVVTLSFWCLTVWRNIGTAKPQAGTPAPRTQSRGWLWAAVFGFCLGLALLVKQTALLFLLTPVLWVGVEAICRRRWGRVSQLVGGLLLSVAVFGPWYRTNWLFVLTAGKRATVDSAIAEGDPALNTLAAWTYYWKALPYQISWLLLLVPIVGLLLYWKRQRGRKAGEQGSRGAGEQTKSQLATRNSQLGINCDLRLVTCDLPIPPSPHLPISPSPHLPISPLVWLAVFWLGAYVLCSLNINKDDRYVLPYLPVLSVFLAYGLTRWRRRWGSRIRWGTVGLAVMLMFVNLFPIGGVLGDRITQALSPNAQHYAYLGSAWPHREVIDEIIQKAPYLRSTLGVLPSTAEINQHNLNYYGALRDFQVYGRQVGTQKKQISQDVRSLDWFLTKTGDQGSVPEAQGAVVQAVELSPDFQLNLTWNLPDGSTLKLYHRRTPSVQAKPLGGSREQGAGSREQKENVHKGYLSVHSPPASPASPDLEIPAPCSLCPAPSLARIALSRVKVPEQAPPGAPVPVTYEWSGSWKQLQSGLVLLSWRNRGGGDGEAQGWLHDHGIGMGALVGKGGQGRGFQVVERMAMLPPADIPPGIYTLEATYLNRQTGESYPIPVPPVMLKIEPETGRRDTPPHDYPTIAPELDLPTQLRTLATALPKGIDALGPVFEETARINQYDPIQDYLVQTQLALEYRLRLEPHNQDWAYALALSRVLKRQVNGAIAALERVTQIDSHNPYPYAYLAFVHLYNWHPSAAEAALKSARALNPNLPELQALSGVAALMQGNIFKAWQHLQALQVLTAKN